MTELTRPERVVWCDGSTQEWTRLTDELVAVGTLTRLNPAYQPDSFLARTDPSDVARAEDRTFICSADEADAGPTNHWRDPAAMKAEMTEHYRGSMQGRTLYVIPFCMGPLDATEPMFGVELTDSAYVVVSMHIMARTGAEVLTAMTADGDADFVPCLHSVGAPLRPGQTDVAWPCNDTKYITHFPQERMIWSYGSGYGGNSLLGKKCYALRIASVIGRDEGWLAEHMLIVRLRTPQGRDHHLAAAFPSACGKTNLAMLEPTLPGWTAQTLGDDIAWMRFGEDGRLWATNPETGLFGVAPGTGEQTNPNAVTAIRAGHTIFTNVAATPDGDVWWEGLTPKPPAELIDWKGHRWTPEGGAPDEPAAHPNSRFCTPIRQVPTLSPDYDDPRGVPIDALVFGGRRRDTVPLVAQARNWTQGVFFGATLSSETTAAASGQVGVVRRDPMAMRPFLGYHAADYFAHWLGLADVPGARLPAVFCVNWFRRGDDGGFLWPGFGENARVLAWMVGRLEGTVDALETPAGLVPAPGALDLRGLDVDTDDVTQASAVQTSEWTAELPDLEEWLTQLGPRVPAPLWSELESLRMRLDAAS